MQPFTERVVEIIKGIPEGKVMTYGQIATLAGSHRAARQVVRVLHSLSEKYKLPWHRVINSKGEISLKDYESHNLQKVLLQGEGVKFTKEDTIDLNKFQFHEYSEFEWQDYL